MHRALTANLALAGLMLLPPALWGQERILSPTFLAPTLTSIALRAPGTDSATARTFTLTAALQEEDDTKSRIGRMVTFTLVGALAGGALGYYTTKTTNTGCFNCEVDHEPRMIKGALIGGSLGLTLGVLVTLGGGAPRMTLRRGD